MHYRCHHPLAHLNQVIEVRLRVENKILPQSRLCFPPRLKTRPLPFHPILDRSSELSKAHICLQLLLHFLSA